GVDVQGQPKYTGESAVCGRWAGALAERLGRSGLRCEIQFYNDWRRVMFEHLVFDCAINLVGALHNNQPVKDVARYYQAECIEMIEELARALRGILAVTLLYGYEERILAYAESPAVADAKTGVEKETFPWRHGFFYDMSMMAREKGWPDPCPMHSEYLGYGNSEGLFSIQ
ncbi:unnamed protein product, partial [Phaeothamnion confervicola]